MSDSPDDLEAVRTITKALEPFDTETRERVIRWAKEKLGLQTTEQSTSEGTGKGTQLQSSTQKHKQDIKTFVAEKNPISDTHFAATVAYYYKFEAPESERKDSISADDLQEACRKVNRDRLKIPSQTLINAHRDGFLDKAGEKGKYSINSVGENLVAITLPGGTAPRKKTSKKATTKRTQKAKGK